MESPNLKQIFQFPENAIFTLLDDNISGPKKRIKEFVGAAPLQFTRPFELLSWVKQGGASVCHFIDINLENDLYGIDVIPGLRELDPFAPIIIYSGSAESQKIIQGFDYGADDYFSKSIEKDEFVARLMRRLKDAQTRASVDYMTAGDLSIDKTTRTMTGPKGSVDNISPINLEILTCLATRPNVVFDKNLLKTRCWGKAKKVSDQAFHRKIFDLRQMLETIGSAASIKSSYDQGLVLVIPGAFAFEGDRT